MFKYITYKYATELRVAYGHSNHNQTEENTSFYRFPNNAVLTQKWINACKRANKDETQWNPQGKMSTYVESILYLARVQSKSMKK